MENIILVFNIILAIVLVVIILLQKSEGGALGLGASQESFISSRSAGGFLAFSKAADEISKGVKANVKQTTKTASILSQQATRAAFFLQLNHPGRQMPASLGQPTWAPSAVPMALGKMSKLFNPPQPMSQDKINDIIRRFVTTARLAEQAGFDGVEIYEKAQTEGGSPSITVLDSDC